MTAWTKETDRQLVDVTGGWQTVGIFGADVKVGSMYLDAIDVTWYALSVDDGGSDDGGALVWLSEAERRNLIVALGGSV